MFFYPELSTLKTTRYVPDHEVIGELIAMLRRAGAKMAKRREARRSATIDASAALQATFH